jgi:uncharacterized RmlC-like cupin family protein
MTEIEITRPDDRVVSETGATSGVNREQAFAGDDVWVGLVRTAPRQPSGWHHHGENETYFWVEQGTIQMEFGANGARSVIAHPGDFVHVPAGLIHREVNPTDDAGVLLLVRVGSGQPVVNVDGPATA